MSTSFLLLNNLFTQHLFHPDIIFFKSHHEAIIEHTLKAILPKNDEIQTFLDNFYALLEKLSKDKKRYSFQLKAQKNSQQLISYTQQLLTLYPSLTIIHMDLYIKTNNDWYFSDKPRVATDYEEFKCYKTTLLNIIITNGLKDELAGYAWKVDHNAIKGYFCHLLLFFNKKQPITQLTNWLNALWHDSVSENKGGVITTIVQTNQQEITPSLQYVIDIMTRLDTYLYFQTPGSVHDKTFGRGRISTKKIAYAKQQQENTKRLLTIGSPLMASKPHSLKPTDVVPYQKIALAHLFINQNTVNYDRTYHPLIELNELDSIQQLSLTNTVETLFSLTQLTRQLVSDDTPHYQWIESAKGGESLYASELGKTLYYFLCQDLHAIQSTLSGLTLNAALTLFFKTFRQWQPHHPIDFDSPKDFLLYQALNDFVIQLRNATINDNKSSIFSLDNAHQKAIDKNYRLLKKYTQTLQRKYSALFVYHVELAYNPAYCLFRQQSSGIYSSLPNHRVYDEVKKHRQLFLKQLNKQYGQRLAGFAWKLKYSQDKGFYHEWLVFLDEHQEPAISESIQLHSLWLGITQKKGSTHFRNCRLNKTKDYRRVIPKEQRIEQQTQLEAMLCSLTLVDEFVYFDPKTLNIQSTDRTFNRGHL